MKKFEEELENELEKELNSSLKDEQKPDLSRFDKALENNKKTKLKLTIFRRIAIACTLVLMITISCFIPYWTKDKDPEPEIIRYYGDDNTVQITLTEDFVKKYINTNLPNYNFIFEDCSVSDILGIYDEETSQELLALTFKANKLNTPVMIEINIVLNKNYTYSEHNNFILNATTEKIDNKTIYSKQISVGIYTKYYYLFERPTYNTYLILNINDLDIINNFKEN